MSDVEPETETPPESGVKNDKPAPAAPADDHIGQSDLDEDTDARDDEGGMIGEG